LFAGVTDLLAAVARRSACSVALMVEDVHWADSATLDCLTFLARAERWDGVRLVATCRGDEAPLAAHVAAWLAQMRAGAGVEEMRLAPLSRAQVAEQVAALAGAQVSPHMIDELFARAQGNPFFTEQLVAAALAGREPQNEPGKRLRIPAGLPGRLAELLTARADRCAGDGRAVLAGLAVADRPLTEAQLGEVTGLDTDAVRQGLQELAAARLLAEGAAGGGTGRGTRCWPRRWPARCCPASGPRCTSWWRGLVEPLTAGPPDSHKWLVQVTRAEIDLLRGEMAAAWRWEQIYAFPSVTSRVDFAYEAARPAMEASLWAGRPGDALDETRRALALFKAPDLTIVSGRLLTAGMWACADLAEQARARHDQPGAGAAAAAADDLTAWVGQMGGAPFTDHPFVAAIPAERATWDAERARAAGRSDPDAWADAAQAWQDLGCPHRAAYAWWRQARAQLDAGQPVAAAARPLQAVEPGRPARFEDPLDRDLVVRRRLGFAHIWTVEGGHEQGIARSGACKWNLWPGAAPSGP
jgi:hypothetical protein